MNFVKGRFENAGTMQFNSGGIRLSLPEAISNRLKNTQNENITLGGRKVGILKLMILLIQFVEKTAGSIIDFCRIAQFVISTEGRNLVLHTFRFLAECF